MGKIKVEVLKPYEEGAMTVTVKPKKYTALLTPYQSWFEDSARKHDIDMNVPHASVPTPLGMFDLRDIDNLPKGLRFTYVQK